MALSRGSKWFISGAVFVVAGIAGGLWWIDENLFDDDVETGQPVEYSVERGATVRDVGDDLAELGVVSSSVRFRIQAGNSGLDARLLPGLFELETGMAIEDAIDVLAAGPIAPPSVRFVVPEGLALELTLERLDEQFDAYTVEDFRAVLDERVEAGENADGVLSLPEWVPEPADAGDEVIEPFEGLLWPQTYEVSDEATPLEVLQTMIDQLAQEVDAIPQAQRTAAEEELGLDPYAVLVVASLIERETQVDAERPTVAGVIANRLADGMRLQIDATVLYARGEHTARVLTEDTEIDSPYNTYAVEGLPPTPISGVGSAALEAAYDPEDVSYFFYVLDPACDGSHRFADTIDEHNVNVEAFREAGGCQ